MRIFKDENGKIIIDGMNVTTVKIQKDLEGKTSVLDLIVSRIKLEGDIEITGFHFEGIN